MVTDATHLKCAELTNRIIGVFYDVYNELGSGFLESVYEEAMFLALNEAGLKTERQVLLRVWFRGRPIKEFKADLVVEGQVILELKAAREFSPNDEPQLLNALRATEIEVGLLLNFGPKPEFKRAVFDNSRKKGLPKENTNS
jgi:GxxExxY protein